MRLCRLFAAADRLEAQIDQLTQRLEQTTFVLMKEIQMSQVGLEALRIQVERAITVQSSAIELIQGLAEEIRELAKHPDQQALTDLADELAQHADALAQAVAAHGEEAGKGEASEEGEEPGEAEKPEEGGA